MLSPTWGVYSGYELFEGDLPVRPGSEEYLDSEKYQLRPRDVRRRRGHIGALAGASAHARSTSIRREHPALHRLTNLHIHEIEHPAITCFSKHDEVSGDTVLVICSTDPHNVTEAMTNLDLPRSGWTGPKGSVPTTC